MSELRFGALRRVSTDQQAAKGESLKTQTTEITKDVELLEGSIVGWYGGSEHATPGHEKLEIDRLIRDASTGRFNAVICSNADRWSRDNEKSQAGLDVFKKHKIKFFVSVTEYDLYSPEHQLFLEMSAVIGKFLARNQKRKSLLNRIHRAKRGIPTVGLLPFGRTYDREREVWAVDEEKRQQLQEIARRYLKGERLPALALEYGHNHSNLHKTLRHFSGPTWNVDFKVDDLDIDETVPIQVPPLLDADVIRDVIDRMDANRTYLHGTPTNEYLLGGRVYCSRCGYAFCGDTESKGYRVYRHPKDNRARKCGFEVRPRVRADILEDKVIKRLFNLFGNPAEIVRSVEDAVPDSDALIKQRTEAEKEMEKIAQARSRILAKVVKDLITDADAEPLLADLKDRQAEVQRTIDRVSLALRDLPDLDAMKRHMQQSNGAVFVYGDDGETYPGGNDLATFLGMDYADKRRLVTGVFNDPMPDGSPAGIYIDPVGIPIGRRMWDWNIEIKGRLEFNAVLQCVKDFTDPSHTGSVGAYASAPPFVLRGTSAA